MPELGGSKRWAGLFAVAVALVLTPLLSGGQARAEAETFRDWYADCSEATPSCRADTFIKGENNPIGFDYRLTWERAAPDKPFVLLFNPLFDPVAPETIVTLRVDSKTPVELEPGSDYRMTGDEGYALRDAALNDLLMEQMRAGSAMTIAYDSAEGEEIEIDASLLGLTAALNFIESARPSQSPEVEDEPEQEEDAAAAAGEELPEDAVEEIAAITGLDEEIVTVRLDGEWPDDLFLFEKAMAACLKATAHKPARVGVAWVLDQESVAVKLLPWEGEAEFCAASWDGAEAREVRPLRESDSAPASGPIFSPVEFGKPEGECYDHEPVAQENGTPIGWLSYEGC